MKNQKGFTLVELLIVISVIGLLAGIVSISLNSGRTKAKYAKAQVALDQFIKTAVIAQGEAGKRLQDITGERCSDCFCRGRDIRNVSTSDACYTKWLTALTRIQSATAGAVSGLDQMVRDPWGSPYGFDENEREASPSDCRLDSIRSAGPDGILYNSDDQLGYAIPPSRPCP